MEIGRPYSRLLCRLEHFDILSLHDRQRVAELPLTVVNCVANQQIVRIGEKSSRCTLVLGGFLCGHKQVGGSRRQITSFFVPGDIADLHALHLPSPDQDISALGPAVVAFLPRAALADMLGNSPRLAKAFWRETLMQAAVYREWIINLGRRDAIARVAHVLCELILRLQTVGLARDLCFSMHWTQMDLADACGISNVHANRIVQELRRLRLIDWDSRQIRIRDWEALVRLGDFSPNYLHLRDAEAHGISAPQGLLEPAEP
jgi:CRP-like cAMP-binding protein